MRNNNGCKAAGVAGLVEVDIAATGTARERHCITMEASHEPGSVSTCHVNLIVLFSS